MKECMDNKLYVHGWMSASMDGWMEGGRMSGWTCMCIHVHMYSRMDELFIGTCLVITLLREIHDLLVLVEVGLVLILKN